MAIVISEETFRPAFGRTLTAVVVGMCALVALGGLTGLGAEAVLTVWPWLAMIGGGCWILYWNPRVVVSGGGVRIVNPFRTIDIPWPAIESIETRWALTLTTTFGRFRAWAAPAPGRQVMRRSNPEDRQLGGVARSESVRPSDLPATESGAAALIVRQRWERLRRAGHLDEAVVEFDRAPVHWHWGLMAATVVVVAAATLGLLI